ncbi:hypothetical protein [Glycomyces sp. NRRL B-16210]|uniref:hypothetical protein n=1 Tax=Glycomyces sp. NRRL B-16210 TaxID=1463821 RepID=UPI0004C2806B|nr:hypothetical protein [Glycomyces sp. NRRL B-16210]
MTDDPFAAGEESTDDPTEGAEGGFFAAGSLELPSFTFTIAFGDTASAGGARAGCSSAECPHPVAHPAEEEWVRLASAVPVEGQLHRFKPRCEGMAYPTEADFRAAVAAVRPEDADAFSLQRLRTGWTEEVASVIGQWPGRLKSSLSALSEGWAGEDFDAFAAQADQARQLLEGVIDDVEAGAAELEGREAAIYTLQGGDSGEIPYPAPLVGCEGDWSEMAALHVRPAWWHGDCIRMTCEEAERALELAGADAALATEVREFIEEKVGEGLLGLGAVVSDVRRLAGEEAKEVFSGRVAAEVSAYLERQAAIDEAIAEKRAGQSEELAAVRVPGEDRPWPSSADTSYMDLSAPQAEHPAPPAAPQTIEDPTPVPPGGDGSTATEEAEPEDENPWDAAENETTSGGLASGGGFSGGAGGAFGAGGANRIGGMPAPGGPGGVPQGLFGPAITGTAAPAATGGAGGARPGHVQGPQSGAPGKAAARSEKRAEERAEEPPQDLARRETGNVWGYVKPNEDPYN